MLRLSAPEICLATAICSSYSLAAPKLDLHSNVLPNLPTSSTAIAADLWSSGERKSTSRTGSLDPVRRRLQVLLAQVGQPVRISSSDDGNKPEKRTTASSYWRKTLESHNYYCATPKHNRAMNHKTLSTVRQRLAFVNLLKFDNPNGGNRLRAS